MGRSKRLEYEGAYHHIMNRGAAHREIFSDDRDRQRFLKLIGEAHERFAFEVHAFCLMGNHFHLLSRTPLANTGDAIHHVTSCFASWFNHRRGIDGPLFRGRYLAKHVDQTNYLLHVSRYIHLNPVEANMVGAAHQYPWSSMASYLGEMPKPEWLFTGQVLAAMGGRAPRKSYAEFVRDGERGQDESWYLDGANSDGCQLPSNSPDDTQRKLDHIDHAVAHAFHVETGTLSKGTRGRRNIARMVAVALGRETTDATLKTLAAHYKFGGTSSVRSAISALESSLEQDQELCRIRDSIALRLAVPQLPVPGTSSCGTQHR